mgnify:CR=1
MTKEFSLNDIIKELLHYRKNELEQEHLLPYFLIRNNNTEDNIANYRDYQNQV